MPQRLPPVEVCSNPALFLGSKGKQTDLILLDFSKAFDKVNHSKLLWKLHQYGIRGNALAWIRAFLGNRSQTVVIDGEESESVPVTSGVPQGSVLGPILFLIYINDLPDELSSQVRLFADDTAVYLTTGDTEDGKVLQNDLDRLSVWEDRWDMEFNPSKCKVVRVTTSKRLIDVTYTLHGQVLEVVTSARYLGVDISSGLSWNPHIDRITKIATRTLNFIQRNIKTKRYERLPTAHWSATSWIMQPPFGTPTLKKKDSSWKKFNAGQHAGPLAISTTGQALLLS